MTHPSDFRRVTPTRPAAPYIGGKRQLAARLCTLIEAVPHRLYAEPFVGMGGVFLRRRQAPRCEVINDVAGDVATLFRVLQRHYPAFMDELRYRFTGRAEFERLMAVDPTTCTDIERSVRFLYLQRTCFGGKVSGRTFGVSLTTSARFDVLKLGEVLNAIADRLSGVVIENLAWRAFVNRYDRPDTLFYFDPPYWGSEDYYGRDLFPKAAFADLATVIGRLKGRFILTVNDCPETRELFGGFDVQDVDLTYQLCGSNAKPARELIVTG